MACVTVAFYSAIKHHAYNAPTKNNSISLTDAIAWKAGTEVTNEFSTHYFFLLKSWFGFGFARYVWAIGTHKTRMSVQNLRAIVKKNEELPRTLGTQSFKSRASHWKTKTKVYFSSHAQNIVSKTHQVYNTLSNPKQTYPYSCRKVKYCFETHTTYCSTYRIREQLELNLIIHLVSMPRELPSKILALL